ncbi:HNH endonuclease [Streptomyces sp. NPDC001700]
MEFHRSAEHAPLLGTTTGCTTSSGPAVLAVGPGGHEGAHVRALGSPHNGPDTTGNVLCLCPNCHVMLDVGAIVIEDDLTVIRSGQPTGSLRTHPQHTIDMECLRHHRERWRQ